MMIFFSHVLSGSGHNSVLQTGPRGLKPRLTALTIGALALITGCATTPGPHDAAPDVRAFAMALRDRDLPAIEAKLDRPALEKQISGLMRALAADAIAQRTGGGIGGWIFGGLGANLAGPIIEYLSRRALSPEILADIARQAGLTPQTSVPSQTLTAIALRRTPDGRVCAPDPATRKCLLYFGKYPSGWKLNAIDEVALRTQLGQAKPPAKPPTKGQSKGQTTDT